MHKTAQKRNGYLGLGASMDIKTMSMGQTSSVRQNFGENENMGSWQ